MLVDTYVPTRPSNKVGNTDSAMTVVSASVAYSVTMLACECVCRYLCRIKLIRVEMLNAIANVTA